MRNIHLPSLSTVVLTVDRNRERHVRMRKLFADYGFTNVRWIFGKPTDNHHVGAKLMAIETLRSIHCPTLWLEDDATVLDSYTPEIQVPDDTQAAYLGGGRLGTSLRNMKIMRDNGRHDLLDAAKPSLPKHDKHGTNTNGMYRRSLYMDTAYPEWIRILTMFTGHAILWLDDSVCQYFADVIENSDECYDIAWSYHQWRFTIYCLRSPFFYQDDGHHAHTITYCPDARSN